MPKQPDILEQVIAELERRTGDLPAVAKACGIPYDTVMRIKRRENDPGYSRVRQLYDHLFAEEVRTHA